jgi:predicted 2-oxoglutarate/Fe(II)-dependent dioxygenase YbiX
MLKHELHGADIFVVRDFLTPDECLDFITAGETAGFGEAPITMGAGFVLRKDIRDNDRAMVDDPDLAARLFERLRPFLPPQFIVWEPAGLNERFRYYRYTRGQKFDWHMDGAYRRANGEASRYTFMIYLSARFVGGETVFNLRRHGVVRDDDEVLTVVPEAGMALLFRHDVLHTGAAVEDGTKYVLRTDVMYRVGREE